MKTINLDIKGFPIVLGLFFALFAIIAKPEQAGAEPCRLMGQSVPPFSKHSADGKVSGFSADLYELVFADIANAPSKNEIVASTFKRIYADLQRHPRRVAILFGKNPERAKLFKWVGPYMSLDLKVIAHKQNRFRFGSVQDFGNLKISTIRNTAPEQALMKLGLSADNLDQSLYPENLVKMLAAGRTKLMAYPYTSAMHLMRQQNIRTSDYEAVFHISSVDLYFAFSRDFDDSEITGLQQRLNQVLDGRSYQALKQRYALN